MLGTRRRLLRLVGGLGALGIALLTAQYVSATPPSASFTAPGVLQIGVNGTFTSTTPDPDADGNAITLVEWDFEADGTYDATGTSVQHSYPTAGTRTVRMRVTDSANEQAETTGSVRVNRVPTASFTALPSPALIGQTVNFNGSGSSDDTSIASYEWDLDGNGSFETNTGSDSTTSLSYSEPGTRQVKLRVTDADGSVSPVATRNVMVNNGNPTASFTATPNPAAANQVVTFNGSASSDPDPGGAITKYEWDLDGNGSFERDTGTSASTTYGHPTPGSRTVQLRVTDNNGATGSTARTVTVNSPPTASFTASPNPQVTGQPVSLNGSASHDNDGGTIVDYAWDLDGNGSFEHNPSGATATTTTTYATAGTKQIGLQVTDNNGGTGTTTRQVVIHNAPTASFTALAPVGTPNRDVPEVGETVTFDGSASSANDAGGSITKYEWDLDGNGSLETVTDGPIVTNTYGTPGTRNVKLRVTDDQGAQSPVVPKNLLVNAPPVANINILNSTAETGQKNTVPLAGQVFVFYPLATTPIAGAAAATGCPAGAGSPAALGSTDAEAAIASYQWDLDNNGTFETAGGMSGSAPSPPQGYPAGTKTVGLRVTDSNGAQTTTTRSFRINSAPTPQFAIEPVTPVVNQPITFASTSADPDAVDNDQLTYSWDLDNDGTFCEPTEPRAQTVSRSFPAAGTYTIKLRVTDTGGITREVTRTVMVQNTIPRAGFKWSPTSPLPGQAVALDASPSAATAGKQITSYHWDLDFDPSKSQFDVDAQGVSASHAFPTAGTKTIALRVTETDGGFATVFDRIVVNAPPRASFGVAPASPLAGDVVTLSSTSADPDGPLAGQAWDLDNDGAFDDATGAVASVLFAAAGTYTVALRVTDDKGARHVASNQIQVSRRPLPALRVLPGVAVQIAGRTSANGAELTLLNVRAPKGSKVVVKCKGPECPKRKMRRTVRKKNLRFKKYEQFLRAGVTITVVISKDGFISRYTEFKIRRGKPPKRVDLCIQPGGKRPTSCPT